jgi:hypothetical protein
MRRVRFSQTVVPSGSAATYGPGDVAEVYDDVAERLVAAGVANYVDEPAAAVPQTAPEAIEAPAVAEAEAPLPEAEV